MQNTRHTPTYILAAAQTTDGFIAPADMRRSITWVSPEDKTHFQGLLKTFDWVVAGRTTAGHHAKDLHKFKCLVLTSTPDNKVAEHFYHINPARTDPVAYLAQKGAERVGILGGTGVYDYFLDRGLLHELWLTIEPLTFGKGVPTFTNPQNIDAHLQLISRKKLNTKGTELLHYKKAPHHA